MKLVERIWTTVSSLLNILTLSPFNHEPTGEIQQFPLFDQDAHLAAKPGPIFRPPGRLRDSDDDFKCDYSGMTGWTSCSTPGTRGCWLEKKSTGEKRDVSTNYELERLTPQGVTRNYHLYVSKAKEPINVDGLDFNGGFVFNDTYSGPWIQACWGDILNITVTVTSNTGFDMGTSVHWHGIRQLRSMHMDGVPGITQCPIAPGSSFTYTFKAMQYGSSWYHSHYSLQYADGLLGPLTIHGPSSSNWDIAPAKPLFISDWSHKVQRGIGNMTRSYPDIAVTKHLEPFNLTFVEGTKYLLRVINVAYDSTFLFTIDNHNFTVISADFVPIVPYNASSIAVGIGQRYNIVVEAKPFKSNATDFWIRTYILHGAPNNPNNCHTSSPPNTTEYMKTGIIRYDESSRADPTTDPWGGLDIETCRDEPPFAPFVEWKPKPRVNPKEPIRNIRFGPAADPTVNPGRISFVPSDEKTYVPLRIDWQNITFLNLNNPDGWNDSFVVLPEQHIQTEWIYLVITNPEDDKGHPIHLHGHDFAIVDVAANKNYDASQPINIPAILPRRDVVFLPEYGYVVIAFPADNPGAWLIHCHIAKHASMGLAMQVLEDRIRADLLWPVGSANWTIAQNLCTDWKKWCVSTNTSCTSTDFQDDSGI